MQEVSGGDVGEGNGEPISANFQVAVACAKFLDF